MKMLTPLFLSFFIFTAAAAEDTTPQGNTILVEAIADSAQYSIKVSGLETECPVLFVQEFLSGKITTTPGYIREDGTLAHRREDYPTMSLDFKDAGPGEPIILNIFPCDRTRSCSKTPTYTTEKFIPRPLETVNAEGITLSCEVNDLKAQSFLVKMQGLLPGEEVTFTSMPNGEDRYIQRADLNGVIEFYFIPEGTEIKAFNKRIQLAL